MHLEKEIDLIKERNKRVEADKAWEGSLTRRFFIALFTYIVIALYMSAINVSKPLLNAIIPTTGFLLSTLTLSYIKQLWIKKWYSPKKS